MVDFLNCAAGGELSVGLMVLEQEVQVRYKNPRHLVTLQQEVRKTVVGYN